MREPTHPDAASHLDAAFLPVLQSVLQQRRKLLAQPVAVDESEDSLEIVVFCLGEVAPPDEEKAPSETAGAPKITGFGQYAFETTQVREVFPVTAASQIAFLPGTPPWVRGILNVRGHILAVLDLQELFGLPQTEIVSDAPVLILRGEVAQEQKDNQSRTSSGQGDGEKDAATDEKNDAATDEKNDAATDEANVTQRAFATTDVALATTGVAGVRLLPRSQLETVHALDGSPGARYLRGLMPDGTALLDAALLLLDMQLIVHSE